MPGDPAAPALPGAGPAARVDGVGDSALRVLIPAGIAVITGRQILPHLHHREHAAHLDRSERTCARHHGQGVGGKGIDIAAMSAMPVVPIAMALGAARLRA